MAIAKLMPTGSDQALAPPPPQKRTDGRLVANKNCWAAVSPEKLKQFYRFADVKDYVAMQKMENAGEVILIPQYEEVFDEYGGFAAGAGGYRAIRRKGQTEKLYADAESLDSTPR